MAKTRTSEKGAEQVRRRQRLRVPEGLFCQLKRVREGEERSSGGLKAGGGRR